MVLKYYQKYASFLSIENKNYYGVLALTDDFNKLLLGKPPVMIETSLLPYKGKIVWDGLIAILRVSVGKNIESLFVDESDMKKKSGDIILQL